MHKHSYTHTHIHTHTHANTRMHTKTRMHASMRSRAPTHTNCSFVIRVQSLWSHLPDTVKKAGSIELFKQIPKTFVFSQYFEIPFFSKFITVPSTLCDLFVVKNGVQCPASSHKTPVSTCAMYWTLSQVEKCPCDYVVRLRQILTLREWNNCPHP